MLRCSSSGSQKPENMQYISLEMAIVKVAISAVFFLFDQLQINLQLKSNCCAILLFVPAKPFILAEKVFSKR